MFSGSQQGGFLSIFYSVGSNPLSIWDKQVKNGHIRRIIDDEVKSLVLDIGGTNVATTYITSPIKPRASLGIKLPYLVMVIRNMKKYFSFEIQILDDKDMRRRFRVSNFQSTTKVTPFCTTMPIGLSSGWNQVQFNLADFTKRAYGSVYLETVRVQIHANVRIRRIYFTDQLHNDEDLPNEFKLMAPGTKSKGKEKKPSKEGIVAPQVPPIAAEPKAEEEIPPPPTPAEMSPVPLEAVPPAPEPVKVEPEQEAEQEPSSVRTEPESEAVEDEEIKVEEEKVTPEEEAPPLPEGELPRVETTPIEGLETLIEPTDETSVLENTEPAEAEPPSDVEAVADTEQTETTADETDAVTEATSEPPSELPETEATPSEPATEQEEEA